MKPSEQHNREWYIRMINQIHSDVKHGCFSDGTKLSKRSKKLGQKLIDHYTHLLLNRYYS